MCRCQSCSMATRAEEAVLHDLEDLVDEAFDDLAFDLAEEDWSAWDESAVLPPPGICSWARHNALQRLVDQACGKPGLFPRMTRSCDNRHGCGVLRKNGIRNIRCAQARAAINQQCYGGGNRVHRQAQREAARAANNCRVVFRGRRCGGTQFFD
jgi:hypothetical protein